MSLQANVVRGVRMAAILFVIALLLIAAYRIFQWTPANAEPSTAAVPPEPAPEVVLPAEGPVEVPPPPLDPRSTPKSAPPKAASKKAAQSTPPPPPLTPLQPIAPSLPAPPQPRLIVVVPEAGPPSSTAAGPPANTVPVAVAPAVPPQPPVASKAGSDDKAVPNPATRAIRSVGRVFGIGRKASGAPKEPAPPGQKQK